MKIRHDGIPPAYQDHLDEYCEKINTAINFTKDFEKLTPDLLKKNLSEKTAMKQLMNRIIGNDFNSIFEHIYLIHFFFNREIRTKTSISRSRVCTRQ